MVHPNVRFAHWSLSLLLLCCAVYSTAQGGLVVNEISQGPNFFKEYAELVVVGDPCSTVDLRGWIVDDNNGIFTDCGPAPDDGALAGYGIAAGHVRFTNDAVWEAVPVGTIILLYAFDPGDPNAQANIGGLVPDYNDSNCDFVRVCPINSSNTFMERDVNLPHGPDLSTGCPANRTCPNGTTGDPSYNPFFGVPLDDQSFNGTFGGPLGLRNDGDGFQTRSPNTQFFHGFSYGSPNGGCVATPPPFSGGPDGIHINDQGSNKNYFFTNFTNDDFRNPANFTSGTASIQGTPGQPNNCENAQWIGSLRRPPEIVFVNGGGGCTNPSAPPVSLCVGEQTVLSLPPSTGCTSDSYAWNFSGTGSINIISGGSGTSLTIEAASPGSVTVTITATIDNDLLYNQAGCTGPPFPQSLDYTFPITITTGPPATPATLTACDAGNGSAVFDLTSVEGTVNGGTGNPVNWYLDMNATQPINNPSTFVSGSVTVYATMTSGTCVSDPVAVVLTVLPTPTANTATLTTCDEGGGQGTFDLSEADATVNGGTGNPVSYWSDPAATLPIPTIFSSQTNVIYATVTDGPCMSASVPINLIVESTPNTSNSLIMVTPNSSCGPVTVDVQFFFPGTSTYDWTMEVGNAGSGYVTVSGTGASNGDIQSFPITETTEFILTGVGISGNASCFTSFSLPITQVVTINPAGTPNLGTADVCETDGLLDLTSLQDPMYPTGTWSGPGVSGADFDPSGLSGPVSLTFTSDDPCASPASTTVNVDPEATPQISGGTFCNNAGLIDLTLLEDPSYPGGAWSGMGVSGNQLDPDGMTGTVTLTYTPVQDCTLPATTMLTLNEPPGFTNLTTVCDASNQNYTVSFTITGGDPTSYTVNGQPLSGNNFTSTPIPSGTPYSFELDDGNSCGPVQISGVFNCDCNTDAGTMNLAAGPLVLCLNEDFTIAAFYNNDQQLEADDVLQFALHDNPGTNLGTILAWSDDGSFNFPLPVNVGQTYYISPVAGNDDGTGNVDLSDACLSVNEGIEVEFYEVDFLSNAPAQVCADDCIDWAVTLVGIPPFQLDAAINDGTNSFPFTFSIFQTDTIFSICPIDFGIADGFVELIPTDLSDANCDASLDPTDEVQVEILSLSVGTLAPTLCFGDSLIINGTVYNEGNPSGTEVFPGAAANGCDSTLVIDISYFPLPKGTLAAELCEGEELIVNGTVYNEANPAGQETLAGASSTGCDSLLNVSITFLPPSEGDLNLELCEGEEIVVNGTPYNAANPSGQEVLIGAAANGCDSLLNVSISFLPPAEGNLNLELCEGEEIVVNGTTYNEANSSGQEILTGASINGCDSLLNIAITFVPFTTGDLNLELCEGEQIIVNGNTYDESNPTGQETLVGGSVSGCDSVINVNLSFLPPAQGDLSLELCEGEEIVVNGTTYNEANPSGQEVLMGAASNGCDSILNVSVSFLAPALGSINFELCEGEQIVFNGTTYDETNPSGTEILPGASIIGCDSIVDVNVSFLPPAQGDLSLELCEGEEIVVNGTTYNEANPSGQEVLMGAASNGCDSILNVSVSFLPPALGSINFELCEGQQIVFNGTTYNENNPSGTEILAGASVNGCDSLIDISLSYLPNAFGSINIELSPGESVVINGTTYDADNPDGTEVFPGGASNGCDSILQVTLTFLSNIQAPTTISLPSCAGFTDGSITLDTIFGGKPPYSVSINGINFIPAENFPLGIPNLGSGAYDLIVQDADGNLEVIEVFIPLVPSNTLSLGEDQSVLLGEDLVLNPIANFVIDSINWSPGTYLDCTDCQNPVVQEPLETTVYEVIAFDENGCPAEDALRVTVIKTRELYIPTAFSPNFDGINDEFMVFAGPEVANISEFRVFDRWGTLLYSEDGFAPNDPTYGWDGTFRGREMNPGVYVFYLEVEFIDGAKEIFKGDVTLVR